MAAKDKRIQDNASGDFFVDSTCINCDACRKIAPDFFGDYGESSYVSKQPLLPGDVLKVQQAILSCPVNSIGDEQSRPMKEALESLPKKLTPEIYYNGFNSRKSFGADSYFIAHKNGNWLIDCPRYTPHLLKKFQQMGGVKYIYLTHQDDVADYQKYARKLGTKVIIHEYDKKAAPDADIIITGDAIQDFGDAQILPVPGHTKGHTILCWKGRYLFTGDHFAYLRSQKRFGSFINHCWYDWEEQKNSIAKMKVFKNVDHIFPGHGRMGILDKGSFPDIVDEYLASLD